MQEADELNAREMVDDSDFIQVGKSDSSNTFSGFPNVDFPTMDVPSMDMTMGSFQSL